MPTTQDQIECMREMASALKKLPDQVSSAHVDDWGKFGNFSMRVKPAVHSRSTTLRLKALVRRHLPPGAHIREIFSPVAKYQSSGGHRAKCGYDTPYWTFDIDFQVYDPETNRFYPGGAS